MLIKRKDENLNWPHLKWDFLDWRMGLEGTVHKQKKSEKSEMEREKILNKKECRRWVLIPDLHAHNVKS